MVPNGVRPPQDPPKAAKATKADKFFSAQTVPFDLSVDPWWSMIVLGLPGPSSGLKAAKATKAKIFFWLKRFLFTKASIPYGPLWSLTVSGLPKTLQRRQGRKGHKG